jgi:hypothetical protein
VFLRRRHKNIAPAMMASPTRPPITGPAIHALLPLEEEEEDGDADVEGLLLEEPPGVEEDEDEGMEEPESAAKITDAFSLMVEVVFCR